MNTAPVHHSTPASPASTAAKRRKAAIHDIRELDPNYESGDANWVLPKTGYVERAQQSTVFDIFAFHFPKAHSELTPPSNACLTHSSTISARARCWRRSSTRAAIFTGRCAPQVPPVIPMIVSYLRTTGIVQHLSRAHALSFRRTISVRGERSRKQLH